MKTLIFLLIWLLLADISNGEGLDQDKTLQEPRCYSKFDYDYKLMQLLVKTEERQTNLENIVENQKKLIENLEEKLRASLLPQWNDWSSWSDCYVNCEGGNSGRIQSRSRETTSLEAGVPKQSENETRPCNAVQFAGCVKDYGESDNYGVTYDFADQIAVSTCTAMLTSGNNHVYAVRRQCSSLAVSCTETCSHLGLSCFNALHVYRGSPVLKRNQNGAKGLYVYRYNSCAGSFCGPNFCCCSA